MKRVKSNGGFTLLDALVVIVTIAILVALLPAFMPNNQRAGRRIRCVSNLKISAVGLRLYANDHNDQYPAFAETNSAWEYFQRSGSEIGGPVVLACPADPSRSKNRAEDFNVPPDPSSFAHTKRRNKSLSYFYGADCSDKQPDLILTGDRNISTNSTLLVGKLLYNTNSGLNWTKDIHSLAGNIALADGSVQQFSAGKLSAQLSFASNVVQRFVLP